MKAQTLADVFSGADFKSSARQLFSLADVEKTAELAAAVRALPDAPEWCDFLAGELMSVDAWAALAALCDDDFGIVRARAFGIYDFKIVDPKAFLREVAGSDHNFRLDEFSETMRSRIVSVFSDAMATSNIPVLDAATKYMELGDALLPLINPVVASKYSTNSSKPCDSFSCSSCIEPELSTTSRMSTSDGGFCTNTSK